MDIVEYMRGFAEDHEPDGWPAVKMSQITALCDEIDRLRAEVAELRHEQAVLRDPVSLHANLLRGVPAVLPREQLLHLAGCTDYDALRREAEVAFTLLATMFDAYEDGDECYEDPEDRAGYCGKAINLDEADFDAIIDLLNKHRPRVAALTKGSSHE